MAGPLAEHQHHVARLPDDRLTLLIGVARYDARLPLSYLSFGDPHGLPGTVHLWNDLNGDRRLQPDEVGRRSRLSVPAARTAG